MKQQKIKKERVVLISWVILPILAVWLTTNYLIGALRQPSWSKTVESVASDQILLAMVKNNESLTPITKFEWQKTGLVTLWFDDAWISQFTIGYPLLEEKKMNAALAVTTQLIGFEAYMQWNQVKLLQYKGWEITAHSRTHVCDVSKMDSQMIKSEIVGSQQDLIALGLRSANYVTPCGVDTPEMLDLIKKQYISLRGSEQGFNPIPVIEPFALKVQPITPSTSAEQVLGWLEEAKQNSSWVILMFHQIDLSNAEYSVTPARYREIIEVVEKSQLPVVLPTQILEIPGDLKGVAVNAN